MSYLVSPKNPWVLLTPDNVTPRARTPWAGRRLATGIKSGLVHTEWIGESWEVSVEPSFPSKTETGVKLAELLKDQPSLLGEATLERFGGLPLLVKLLDAAEALSVQIHPADDDPVLADDESGKPEAWYVLHAEPGAGLYLGFRDGVDEASVRGAIDAGKDVSALLRFVEVAPGDYFAIDAGTPHAIGPGLTLLEPQRVLPGKRGLTYRYWDWNRTYDEDGAPSPGGSLRELHLERALAVTRWGAPEVPVRSYPLAGDGLARSEGLVAAEAGGLGLARLSGSGSVALEGSSLPRALTVVAGAVRCAEQSVACGYSALVPAGESEFQVELADAHALVTWVGVETGV